VNTDELEYGLVCGGTPGTGDPDQAAPLGGDDPHRRFDDLFNLVADPAFLLVAWDRVRGNKGASTAGVDGDDRPLRVHRVRGSRVSSTRLRADLKDRSFRPLPVRERMIPKAGGKVRRLGIATIPTGWSRRP
jgi:RNA-directed DNA polymerase